MGQKCTKELFLECPGNGPRCMGYCAFKVCVNWTDPIPPLTLISNLEITFEGRTGVPLVLHPDIIETGDADCDWNFNTGKGSIKYKDENDNEHEITDNIFFREYRKFLDNMDATTLQRCERIRQGGRCQNWTNVDKTYYYANCVPTTIRGWRFKWGCQESEPTPGNSVRSIETDNKTIKIKSFNLNFSIDVTCSCTSIPNTGRLVVDLEGP